MRATLLQNADETSGFMSPNFPSQEQAREFLETGLDRYPSHWLIHFLHAAEIIGYKHPDTAIRSYWYQFYITGVNALHLNPETEDQLNARLSDCH